MRLRGSGVLVLDVAINVAALGPAAVAVAGHIKIGILELTIVDVVVDVVIQDNSVEFEEALGRVGGRVLVYLRCAGEPLPGVVTPAHAKQRVGVRIPQPGDPRLVRPQLGHLQHGEGGVALTEVRARTGGHDEQFGSLIAGHLAAIGPPIEVDRALRPAQRPFAVGQHREVGLPTGHAVVRPELANGGLPLPGVVGGEANRLPYRRDPGRQPPRDQGMGQCRLRVDVDELASGHQTQRDLLGDTTRQRAQLPPDLGIEAAWVKILRQRGTDAHVRFAGGIRLVPSLRPAVLCGRPLPATARVVDSTTKAGPISAADAISADRPIPVPALVPRPRPPPVAAATLIPRPRPPPVAAATLIPRPRPPPVAAATLIPRPRPPPVTAATLIPRPRPPPVAQLVPVAWPRPALIPGRRPPLVAVAALASSPGPPPVATAPLVSPTRMSPVAGLPAAVEPVLGAPNWRIVSAGTVPPGVTPISTLAVRGPARPIS